MKIKEYLKHRWYLFILLLTAGVFSFLVAWASDLIFNGDFLYITAAVVFCVLVFILIDYIKLNNRIIRMYDFLDNGCTNDFSGNYPLDIKYAEHFKSIVDSYKKYREETETEHASELEFITKWVHDVKVPISAIKLITENMDIDETEQIEMQLSYIDQNIQKILYHMKSKRFYDDYKIKEVSTKSIVNQALKSYAVFFAYKSISLEIDYMDYRVYTDEKWSTYIVSQLISNAIKYTDRNGEIEIRAIKSGDEILLSVKNTGIGINEKNINNIFKRGYAGYNTRKEKSTGYGLYLSKKLSDKMGHKLTVDSVCDEYACFTIHYSLNKNNIHYENVSLDL